MLVFASALVFAIGGTPLARRLALHLGIMDYPSARKIHRTPIPRFGGAAIYLAFLLALLIFEDRFNIQQLVGIMVGATWVSFLGVLDDSRGLRPLLKLAGQIAGAAFLILAGIEVNVFPASVLGAGGTRAINVALTIVWIVGITNAMNFLDNMDGLSGGVGAVGAAFFLLLAALSGQYLVGSLAAALLGACLGFLVYNFNPASIFMGDAGSLFLGFTLAAVGIKLRFPEGIQIVTWMVPVLIMGLPLFDTTLVTISRIRRNLNPLTTPGKDHVSHRLVALGYTRREAVLICYLICAGLGVIALFITQANIVEGYIVGGTVALTALVALWRMEHVDFPANQVRGTFLNRRKSH
jgi:UDP-GlcNAc:undecaprenyl-phosphate GlcNAc-1-phosphate transferase